MNDSMQKKTDDRGVARIFQRDGGGGSHSVKVRILTSVMSFTLPVVGCLLKKAYKRMVHGHPRTPLATPQDKLGCFSVA